MSPRVNLSNPLRCAPIEAATAASFALPMVSIPVYLSKHLISDSIVGVIKYLVEKSARAVFHILSNVANNKLTRYVAPSVTYLDAKIEKACTISGKFLGKAASLPVSLTFYLAASAYAVAISWITIPIFTAISAILYITHILKTTALDAYDICKTTKSEISTRETIVSKVGLVLLKMPYLMTLSLMKHTLHYALSMMYRTFSATVSMPLLTPLYTIMSLFKQGNRFDIYSYQNNTGVITDFINDLIEGTQTTTRFPLIGYWHSNRLKTAALAGPFSLSCTASNIDRNYVGAGAESTDTGTPSKSTAPAINTVPGSTNATSGSSQQAKRVNPTLTIVDGTADLKHKNVPTPTFIAALKLLLDSMKEKSLSEEQLLDCVVGLPKGFALCPNYIYANSEALKRAVEQESANAISFKNIGDVPFCGVACSKNELVKALADAPELRYTFAYASHYVYIDAVPLRALCIARNDPKSSLKLVPSPLLNLPDVFKALQEGRGVILHKKLLAQALLLSPILAVQMLTALGIHWCRQVKNASCHTVPELATELQKIFEHRILKTEVGKPAKETEPTMPNEAMQRIMVSIKKLQHRPEFIAALAAALCEERISQALGHSGAAGKAGTKIELPGEPEFSEAFTAVLNNENKSEFLTTGSGASWNRKELAESVRKILGPDVAPAKHVIPLPEKEFPAESKEDFTPEGKLAAGNPVKAHGGAGNDNIAPPALCKTPPAEPATKFSQEDKSATKDMAANKPQGAAVQKPTGIALPEGILENAARKEADKSATKDMAANKPQGAAVQKPTGIALPEGILENAARKEADKLEKAKAAKAEGGTAPNDTAARDLSPNVSPHTVLKGATSAGVAEEPRSALLVM